MIILIIYYVKGAIIVGENISFIHVADLHLDSPFKGLAHAPTTIFEQIRESTFIAFENIVQQAITKKVDFVLLVGDLYENEKQSLRAQVFLKKCFERLKKHQIDVFLSYGNHDYMNGNAYRIRFPDNVYIFVNDTVHAMPFIRNGKTLAQIYGFSYEEKVVNENKTHDYEIKDASIPFHIATLHGSLHGKEGHDPYAPFQLGDMTSKKFDYWALGHIHQREILSDNPPIIYPGNIQARHRNEAGEKGCYYVNMHESDVDVSFIASDHIEFANVKVDISSLESLDEVQEALEKNLQQWQGKNICVHLEIRASHIQNTVAYDRYIAEMIELWNEEESKQDNFVYVYRHVILYEESNEIAIGDLFMEELMGILASDDVTAENIDMLTNHKHLSRYINDFSLPSIRDEARQKLFQLLNEQEVER